MCRNMLESTLLAPTTPAEGEERLDSMKDFLPKDFICFRVKKNQHLAILTRQKDFFITTPENWFGIIKGSVRRTSENS